MYKIEREKIPNRNKVNKTSIDADYGGVVHNRARGVQRLILQSKLYAHMALSREMRPYTHERGNQVKGGTGLLEVK